MQTPVTHCNTAAVTRLMGSVGQTNIITVSPDAGWQVGEVNLAVFTIHGRHNGSDQLPVRPQTGADLTGSWTQRGLKVQNTASQHPKTRHADKVEDTHLQMQVRQRRMQQHVDNHMMPLRRTT